MLSEALNGDFELVVTPATLGTTNTAAAFTRLVEITAENAAGEIHEWFNETIATAVTIADTSTAGTATIPSTTIVFEKGRVAVVISHDAAAWDAAETTTFTVSAYAGFVDITTSAVTSIDTFI